MKRILLIPGDGIGPEVMDAGLCLLTKLQKVHNIELKLTMVDWGAEKWLRDGVGIPEGGLEKIPTDYDAILFGALGDKRIPDMAHAREILLGLRFGLDLFINFRPIKLLHDSLNPLRHHSCADINMVFFRENTQDLYTGAGGFIAKNSINEVAIDESIHTRWGVDRIIKSAFSYAKKEGRNKVTLIDKANAIKHGGSLWQRSFEKIKLDFPAIKADHLHVDVAAMEMVRNPARFDVIVTTNLFGDILSDLGAGITGGLGLAASANVNPDTIALFEPIHGSAPDIVNQQKANPMAMFLSIALMLRYLSFANIPELIEKAVIEAICIGATTPDLRGKLSTQQVTDFVVSQIG